MFDDLNQIDWAGLRVEQAPHWIRGLASEDQLIRIESFHELKDSDIHERPEFARFVIPFIVRILEHQDVNSETSWLIEFLRAMYIYAAGFIKRGIEVDSATMIFNDIDNSVEIIERFLADPLTRNTAQNLISEIEKSRG